MALRFLSLVMAALLALVGCADDDDNGEQADVAETCRLLAELTDDPDEATIEELQEAAPSELDDDVEALGEAEPGSDEFAEAERELDDFEARECDAGTPGGDDDGGPDPTIDQNDDDGADGDVDGGTGDSDGDDVDGDDGDDDTTTSTLVGTTTTSTP